MKLFKRIISAISVVLCITIIWIPLHFMLKTLMYGDKREHQSYHGNELANVLLIFTKLSVYIVAYFYKIAKLFLQ